VSVGRLVVTVAALLAAGVVALGADRPGLVAQARPVPPPAPTWTVSPATPAPVAARPTRLRIPAIGVDSRIVDIGVDRAGVLVPPGTTDVTGWFTAGPVPGTIGPALLAGHVDSRAGPGVFFRLAELRRGDVVVVDRAGGGSVSFVVVSSARVPKTAFPTDLVYSPKPVAMLRLVTCGGSFDRRAGSYRDNLIVNATIR
jgi:sortase (surface protein transpeptidase)